MGIVQDVLLWGAVALMIVFIGFMIFGAIATALQGAISWSRAYIPYVRHRTDPEQWRRDLVARVERDELRRSQQ